MPVRKFILALSVFGLLLGCGGSNLADTQTTGGPQAQNVPGINDLFPTGHREWKTLKPFDFNFPSLSPGTISFIAVSNEPGLISGGCGSDNSLGWNSGVSQIIPNAYFLNQYSMGPLGTTYNGAANYLATMPTRVWGGDQRWQFSSSGCPYVDYELTAMKSHELTGLAAVGFATWNGRPITAVALFGGMQMSRPRPEINCDTVTLRLLEPLKSNEETVFPEGSWLQLKVARNENSGKADLRLLQINGYPVLFDVTISITEEDLGHKAALSAFLDAQKSASSDASGCARFPAGAVLRLTLHASTDNLIWLKLYARSAPSTSVTKFATDEKK